MQTFENIVMRLVQDAVPSDQYSAEFFHGTLILKTNENYARKAWHKLNEYCKLGRVRITKIDQNEYAYDFV